MTVVPFNRQHYIDMILQENQETQRILMTEEIMRLIEHHDGFSALDGDEVLASAGVVELTTTRGLAWAYISANVGNRMLGVTRAVRRYLDMSGLKRIEMDVDCDFHAAHRWAKMLGFEMECERRRAYTPDGRDCALYARVR